jgi:hypothetical protein
MLCRHFQRVCPSLFPKNISLTDILAPPATIRNGKTASSRDVDASSSPSNLSMMASPVADSAVGQRTFFAAVWRDVFQAGGIIVNHSLPWSTSKID